MRWLAECHHAIQWGNKLRFDLFKSRNLGYLLLLAAMTSLAFGLTLFLIDPNIRSPFDGIWSAWVTMTHVGFGDVVPVSFFGRLLASLLILFGLIFYSLFTALVSVSLIGKNMATLGMNMGHIGQDVGQIQSAEDRIVAELARLSEQIETLEKQLSLYTDRDRPV